MGTHKAAYLARNIIFFSRALEDGPGFSMIRVYPRMKIEDTRGCPLPGLATDMDEDFNLAVGRSWEALKRIHRILNPFFVEREMDFGG